MCGRSTASARRGQPDPPRPSADARGHRPRAGAARGKLRQGAVLVDPADMGLTPRVTFLIDHAVKEGRDPDAGRLQAPAVRRVDPQGNASFAGWAPHLDLEPLAAGDRRLVEDVLQAPWIAQNLEQVALALPRPSSSPSTSRRCAPAASGMWTRPWPPSTSA